MVPAQWGDTYMMADVDAGIAGRIIKMRTFIDQRFRDMPRVSQSDYQLRTCAHDALNFFLAGDVATANRCVNKLDLKGAVEFRRKVAELDLLPKNLLPKKTE